MPGESVALVGRNWIRAVGIILDSVMHVSRREDEKCPSHNLIVRFSELFQEDLGTMANIVVNLELEDGARPVFHKARSVPYALKEKVETELGRLVEMGTYEAVPHSDWATPIVPVMKSDGTVRICGDYKSTYKE